MKGRRGLLTRLALACCALALAAVALALVLTHLAGLGAPAAFGITALTVLPLGFVTARWYLQPVLSLFRALEGTVTSYRDGDFSFSLTWPRNDELADLV